MKKKGRVLKRFDLPYGIFFDSSFFFLVSWIFFVQYIEDSRDMQPATPEQLQSIIH
ncbi:hypothetical protein [Klebsiella pneumoniae]|uniref:hypothetical protein n=1 Tax=Klebsiella pneumoniae TaxID=573 RepID=UPI003D98B81D